MRRGEIGDGALRGAYSEVDFASFITSHDSSCPTRRSRNCFPMAALRSSDGAFLLGVMGSSTRDRDNGTSRPVRRPQRCRWRYRRYSKELA